MIPPQKMCNKHLRGEHLELHMFAGSLKNQKDLSWAIQKGYVELDKIEERHNEVAEEMLRRKSKGNVHNSPLIIPAEFYAGYQYKGRVILDESVRELSARCKDCKELIWKNI